MKEDGARSPGRVARAGRSRAARTGTTPEPFAPDVYSYTYYISTLVKENGMPKGSLDTLDAVLNEMQARGIKLGPQLFTPFAWLAFHLDDWKMGQVRRSRRNLFSLLLADARTQRLYATIVRHGLNPSDITYCYFISLAIAANEVRGAGEVLKAAVVANKLRAHKDSTRIVSTMNSLVRACAARPLCHRSG